MPTRQTKSYSENVFNSASVFFPKRILMGVEEMPVTAIFFDLVFNINIKQHTKISGYF